ncbi:MAG: hypothetical protein LOY03_02315 [Cyclobacteriaceae bacterium]|jgi:hypothetical protein|nr:hypothetical protein [Cyclobacteriaceae bacterium]
MKISGSSRLRHRCFAVAALCLLASGCAVQAQRLFRLKPEPSPSYEEVTFEDLSKRYLDKSDGPWNEAEGIYSVSCVIVRKGKPLLGGAERERVIERRDNYARIAILRERPGAPRAFIAVSLSYREAGKYPIVGQFDAFGDGRGLIYKHFEPDGSSMSFSMTRDKDLVEGEYTVMEGRSTVTYRLTFLKVYPE